MRCGLVRDTYEEVELALFLLDGNIELRLVIAKGLREIEFIWANNAGK